MANEMIAQIPWVVQAALLSGAIDPGGRTGVLISGGNVDPEVLAEILG